MQTLNGIGTKLYGKTEMDPDGSYVATEWFVILYLPIFPLGSYRVWPEMNSIDMSRETVMVQEGEKVTYTPLGTKQQYRRLRVNRHWKQIIATYKVGFIFFMLFLFVMWLLN